MSTRIRFTYTHATEELMMDMDAEGVSHELVTETYVRFLRAIGYQIDNLISTDLNDLTYDTDYAAH